MLVGPPGSGLALLKPVALALRLDDVGAVGEPVERRAGEAFGAEDPCPGSEAQIPRDDQARALVTAVGYKPKAVSEIRTLALTASLQMYRPAGGAQYASVQVKRQFR